MPLSIQPHCLSPWETDACLRRGHLSPGDTHLGLIIAHPQAKLPQTTLFALIQGSPMAPCCCHGSVHTQPGT